MPYNFQTELAFTATYRAFQDAHPAIREVECLRRQFPATLDMPHPEDLFVGRVTPALVGFSPDEWGHTAFGYYHLPEAIRSRLADAQLDPTRRTDVEDMLVFWNEHNTSSRLRASYPPEMARLLPSDDWMASPGVAFPLYRMTGGTVDNGRLLARGLSGLREDVQRRREAAVERQEDTPLFDAWLMAIDLMEDVCTCLADACRRSGRHDMADVLDAIAVRAPETLREGIQLFWLYALVADARNHGRMDVWLGDLLATDLENERLTEEEALALLKSLWRLMADRNTVVHNRVIIGGRGRRNETNANIFARLAMQASREVHAAEPQLSLRFFDGQDPTLFAQALDVLAEGCTFPILYNDDVNIPAIQSAFGVDARTAERYVPYGCGEYIFEHESFGTPSGVINLLKALEDVLVEHSHDLRTFEDLWTAWARYVELYVDQLAEQEVLAYDRMGRDAACLHMSLLYDDCLETGKSLFDGGVRYLGGTIETYGNANTADALTALKHVVFDYRQFSLDAVIRALRDNFRGHEHVRQALLRAPKYGNDDDEADGMMVRVHEHVCNYARSQARRVGLHSYLVVIINNSANTLMGRSTGASADGRYAGQPMNNGNAPASGQDRTGLTACLNSLVKPDAGIHAGAVQNMKFSRDMFTTRRPALEALLGTYFDMGGAQAMITVVDRGDLEQAMEDPEKFGHLFVRVGGFSARFVDLPRDVQQEILDRTLY